MWISGRQSILSTHIKTAHTFHVIYIITVFKVGTNHLLLACSHVLSWTNLKCTTTLCSKEMHYGAWWRHQMETLSALLAVCAGNSTVTGEFPANMPATRSFDVFFDLRLHKRLSKQSWGWWFETPSRPLWRHCNWKAFHRDEAPVSELACNQR